MTFTQVPGGVRRQRFEEWVKEYSNAVLRTCYIYLADRAMAEDALQETFLKVWRNIDRFEARNGSSVRTWIIKIAINTCKDMRRSTWRRHIDQTYPIDELQIVAGDVCEESKMLFLDVLRLPDKLKQVVILYHYHDMTMEEAAYVLKISRSAVHHRLKKAYSLLKTSMEGSE